METPNGNIAVLPIRWPSVKIGKQTLLVKWGLVAEYIISSWGMEAADLLTLYNRKQISPAVLEDDGTTVKTAAVFEPMPAQWLVKFFDLFAACVGHNYINLGQDPPKGAYWVSQVDEEDGQFKILFEAVLDALGKRVTAKKAPTPPADLQAEQPTEVVVQ